MDWIQEVLDVMEADDVLPQEVKEEPLSVQHKMGMVKPRCFRLTKIQATIEKAQGMGLPLSAELIATRMIQNHQYDPTDPYFSDWDSGCHPKYATLPPGTRDEIFCKIVQLWVDVGRIDAYVEDPRNRKWLAEARELADKAKMCYYDYILAFVNFFKPICYVRQLKSKKALKIIRRRGR